MTQTVLLTQSIVYQNQAASVVTEPVFAWKFFEEASTKLYVDKRSKLKGTFVGERFVHTGKEIQLRPAVRVTKTRPAEWSGFLFLGILILVVILKRLTTRKYNQLLLCLFSNTRLSLMLREWNPMKNFISFLVVFIYVTTFTLLVQNAIGFMSSYPESNSSGMILFFQIFGGLSLVFAFKLFVIRFLSYLFKTPDETSRYLTNHIGFFAIGGLILLPMLLVMIYNPSIYIVFFSFGIIFILLIFKIIRSFVSGLIQPPFSILYLFLYLCALEIMPLIVLTKIFLMFSNGEQVG